MKTKKRISTLLIPFFLVIVLIECTTPVKKSQVNFEAILSDFKKPAESNTLWCYWYWIDDDVSKEGITKDLEAMKKAGIGTAFIGNINPDEVDGKIPILSEEWWSCMVYAVNEGKRIGIDIGSFNSPGWSQSGGPWIKSDMAMRYVNYTETKVKGRKKVSLKLIKPRDEFQDLYVLAFPSIKAEKSKLTASNSKITVSPKVKNAKYLLDDNLSTVAEFRKNKTSYSIEIKANKNIKARSIIIYPGKEDIKLECDLSALVNGKYVSVKKFMFDRSNTNVNVGPERFAPVAISIPQTNSNKFKLVFIELTSLDPQFRKQNLKYGISEIVISEAVVLEKYVEKHLGKMHPTPFPTWNSYSWKEQEPVKNKDLKIAENNVIDISSFMDPTGLLTWDVPEGEWVIQRYGMSPTGTKNSPAAPQGKGYEVDKANRELVRYHFKNYIGEFLKRIPEESKSAFKYVVADSYETGSQNWTDGFAEKFEKKYGYNPKKYLPVFSGRIVGNVDESERFLWDLRRSVADEVAYEYVGGLKEISNENNLKLWLENYGHWGFPSEFLMYGGQSDLVSGEFWNEGTLGNIECKAASSAAHIYGKPIASAEAFTSAFRSFVRHPAMLKKRGDWSYTEGINHFVLHLYIHQPDERVPGVNAWFGTEFNRHNTWFDKGEEYFNYLRRCQHMLQQGKYEADVCYFIGEDAPIMTGARNPELPTGYSYDYINAEVIMNRLSVKDGKFVLPDGMSYSLMVLPPLSTMRPELLAKIEELVKQGGKIYGQAPEKSPSLQNFPESDRQVQEIANEMWAGDKKVKSYGKGSIVDGFGLKETLDELGISKDVDINGSYPVLWTHRTMPGMDIYFLTNQSNDEVNFSPSFRVNGMKPQLWDAITGEVRILNDYTKKDGRITVPIKMEPEQSWFVVFTNAGENNIEKGFKTNFPDIKVVQTFEELWSVDFKNKQIGPAKTVNFPSLTDWSTNRDDKIKYYSGTAVYKSTFNYKKGDNAKKSYINLGNVGVMASVKINGKDVGTTWIAPYRLEVTKAVKDGKNNIEVEVVNVWRNRISGDKLLPENKRTTSYSIEKTTKEEELISSGLLGPVVIEEIK